MATYVNDLRLKEIGTGESSGTWGTETNVNLELIGEALGFGTEAITTNADTHTTTVADGSTDPGRAMYIKYTGTLDSACTITIGPNTMSRLHYIENGTSGSQNIIISQGSGANITIPAGDTKAVYLDGAGSGAAVVDVFASFSAVDLKVQDDLTVTDDATIGGTLGVTGILTCTDDIIIGDGKTIGSASDVDAITIASNGQVTFTQTLIGTALDISGDIDVDGTANLDIVDIDGATNIAAAVTMATNNKIQFRDDAIHISSTADGQLDLVADTEIQIAATTIDINGAINASGEIIAASLDISGNIDVDGTTNLDVVDIDGAVDMASTLAVGGVTTFGIGVDVDGTDDLRLRFLNSSTFKGGIQTATSSGDMVAGSAVDDLAIRSQGDIRFATGGNTERMNILDTGINVTGTISSTVTDNSDNLTLTSTDADANSGPNLAMLRNSGSPADNDVLGVIDFKGRNDNSTTVRYAGINSTLLDASNGSEDGSLELVTTLAGSAQISRVLMNSSETVLNDDSQDLDFRVESNGQTHALFVDGGLNNVGVGYSAAHTATNAGIVILSGGEGGGIQINREDGSTPSSGELLGSLAFKGTDSANNNTAADASIVAKASQDHSGSAAGANLLFKVKPNDTGPGSGPSTRMEIEQDGKIAIGNNIPIWSGSFGGGLFLKGNNATSDRYAQLAIVDSNGDIAQTGLKINNNGSATFGGAGDVTITDGNLVVASGHGIDFSATGDASGMASELLDDYEEGTWSPADGSGASLSFSFTHNRYTKVGRLVVACVRLTFPSTSNTSLAQVTLPFTVDTNANASAAGGVCTEQNLNTDLVVTASINDTTKVLFRSNGATALTNAQLSGKILRFTVTYQAA